MPVRLSLLLIILACSLSATTCCLELDKTNSSLVLQFDADTLNAGTGFTKQEIRSAYVINYTDSVLSKPSDTLRLPPPGTPPHHAQYLQLYSLPSQPTRFHLFLQKQKDGMILGSYRIVVPASRRIFDIRNVDLELVASDDDCKILSVKQVRFTLNGQKVERPSTLDPVILRK